MQARRCTGRWNDLKREILGAVMPVGPHRQFPLLVKFLDAREDLSVQVHPDQAYADSHPGAHLKDGGVVRPSA